MQPTRSHMCSMSHTLSASPTARVALALALLASAGCSDSPTRAEDNVAAQVQVVSGSGQNGTVGTELPDPLIVKIVTASGRAVANQLVNFRVVSGGGSVFAGSAITNASGIAQERWTLGTSTSGEQSVEARAVNPATGAAIIFASFTATAGAGPVALLEPVAGGDQSALAATALPVPAAVQARDRYGNAVPQAPVTFAVATGGGTILNGVQTTNSDGVATAGAWTLGTDAGPQTLSITAGSAPALTITAVARSRVPAQITRVAGNGQSAGAGATVPIAPRVLVANSHGDPLPGVPVAFTPAAGSGTVSGGSLTTDATGHAAVAGWTLGTTPGAQLLSASAGPVSVEFQAAAVAGAPATLSKTLGDGQTRPYGTALPVAPSVTVRDRYGNPVSGAAVQFQVLSGGGSIGAATVQTDQLGGASVGRWTLGNSLGSQELRATVAGLPPAVFTATAAPRIAARMVAGPSNPTELLYGTPAIARVTVVDEFANPVPGVAVVFSSPDVISWPGGATTIEGAETVTDESGVATVVSWTTETCSGSSRLVAKASSLETPVVMTLPVSSKVARSISLETYSFGNVWVPPRYSVDNPYLQNIRAKVWTPCNGNTLPGVKVTFEVIEGSSRVSFPSGVTDWNGTASTPWTGGTVPGVTRVRASATGYAGALTAEISATLTHGRPAQFVKISGDSQTGAAGTVLPEPLRLRVLDKYGNPAPERVDDSMTGRGIPSGDVPVRFTGLNGPGSTSTFVADSQGIVTATTPWTLGTTPGTQTVTASFLDTAVYPNVLVTATFTAHATAPQVEYVNALMSVGALAPTHQWIIGPLLAHRPSASQRPQ